MFEHPITPAGSPEELVDRIRKHTEDYYASLLEQGHSEQEALQIIEEEVGELEIIFKSCMR